MRDLRWGGVALLLVGCAAPQGTDGTYVVTFDSRSAALDGSGQAVVADAAKVLRADTDRSVTVSGSAASTTSITPAAEFLISRSRSQAVANALVAQGVAQSRIRVQPRMADSDRASESRRVEIVLGR